MRVRPRTSCFVPDWFHVRSTHPPRSALSFLLHYRRTTPSIPHDYVFSLLPLGSTLVLKRIIHIHTPLVILVVYLYPHAVLCHRDVSGAVSWRSALAEGALERGSSLPGNRLDSYGAMETLRTCYAFMSGTLAHAYARRSLGEREIAPVEWNEAAG